MSQHDVSGITLMDKQPAAGTQQSDLSFSELISQLELGWFQDTWVVMSTYSTTPEVSIDTVPSAESYDYLF